MSRLERCTLISPLFTTHPAPRLCAAKCTSANPFVSCAYTLFHFPYPASLLFATLTKTTGVYTNSSHSGTRERSGRASSAVSSLRINLTPCLSHSSVVRIRSRMRIPREFAAADEGFFSVALSPVTISTISFVFTLLHTLLHFFALTQNSTLFFSCDSALFAKNTRVGGARSTCCPKWLSTHPSVKIASPQNHAC
jgi:hypothetical protein